jgi:hypothetical protein
MFFQLRSVSKNTLLGFYLVILCILDFEWFWLFYNLDGGYYVDFYVYIILNNKNRIINNNSII